MATLEQQQIDDGALDFAHIAELATSSLPTATNRVGAVRKTAAGVELVFDQKIADVEAKRQYVHAEMQAKSESLEPVRLSVLNQFSDKLANLTLPELELLSGSLGGSLIGTADGVSLQNMLDRFSGKAAGFGFLNVDLPPFNGSITALLDFALTKKNDYQGWLIKAGPRAYNAVGYYNLDVTRPRSEWRWNEIPNLKFVGSGPGRILGDPYTEGSRLIDGTGTSFMGTFFNMQNGLSMTGMGIDVGPLAVAMNGGKYLEGLVAGTHTNEFDGRDLSKYITDIDLDRILILAKTPAVADGNNTKHSALLEHILRLNMGTLTIVGGGHGAAIKSQEVTGQLLRVLWTYVDAVIFKSELRAVAKDINIDRIVVGTLNSVRRSAGVQLQSAVNTVYPESPGVYRPFVTQNVNIGLLEARKVNFGIEPVDSTAPILGVRIGSIVVDDTTASAVTVGASTVRFQIGKHDISNTPNGIVTEANCLSADIGTGTVTNASQRGYLLNGDMTHGRIKSIASQGFGVQGNGAFFDPSLVDGQDNAAANWTNVPSPTFTFQNGWGGVLGSLRFEVWAKRVRIHGAIGNGTSRTIGVFAAPFRPDRPYYVDASQEYGAVYAAARIQIGTDGVMTLVGGHQETYPGSFVFMRQGEWLRP